MPPPPLVLAETVGVELYTDRSPSTGHGPIKAPE